MIRVAFVILIATITAAIIHIGAIFAIPYQSTNDIWHRVLNLTPVHRMVAIGDPKEALKLSEDLDPAFVYGICRTNVLTAPVLIKGTLPTDFWSMNYIDRLGRSQFSLTNDVSGPQVNVYLATKGQQRLLTERPDLVDDTAIAIQASNAQGILLLRAFVHSEQERQKLLDAVQALSCLPLWEPGITE